MLKMVSSCFYFYTSSLCFYFLLTLICTTTSSSSSSSSSSTPTTTTISYNHHCSSFVPESTPTTRILRRSVPNFLTPYFTGGNKLLGVKQHNQTYYSAGKFLRLRISPNYQKTVAEGVYKVDAFLSILSPYQYYSNQSNSSSFGSYYQKRSRARGWIRFMLTGFWSETSRKLCMVGSASSVLDGITTVDLGAVLKLSFASENPNIYTGVDSGTLESTSSENDPGYFDPIVIFYFPEFSNYSYSLVSRKSGGGSFSIDSVKDRSSDLQPIRLCSMFSSVLEMKCGNGYSGPQDCSLLGLSTHFLALNPIQCSGYENKLRFMAKLQNVGYFDQGFAIESVLIGEASWDEKNKELSGVACRLSNPADKSGHAVRDCTMRLSLKYNSVWTIKNEPNIVGRFWSTKNVEDSEYFRKVNLTSFDPVAFGDLRYEYSNLDKAKKLCPARKPVKKGNIYPDGHSYDMRFDMHVKNSKGEEIAWGYAKPISVGNGLYDRSNMILAVDSIAPESSYGLPEESSRSTNIGPSNISYKILINPSNVKFVNLFPNHNLSMWLQHTFDITAEGVYTAETGYLCMVGCAKLTSHEQNSTRISTDCEILVKLQFASLNDKKGHLIKGTIESVRKKSDPLHFEDLSLSSVAYYTDLAEESIWRMDLEITMVLISNTLLCIFLGLQILHVKRNPEVLSCISLVMLAVLSLGYMIPLVLNFEAVFLGNYKKQTLLLGSGGWVEANEVAVRVITMVAFLLQVRLVQLVWTAKQNEDNEKSPWTGERKSVFVSLTLYILGGVLVLLWNWTRNKFYQKYSVWGNLRSYAGLILDGFLVPQILLNIFSGLTKKKPLFDPFYIGTSLVRLVPHAYNQYRANNYPTYEVNGTYLYANPGADFYSTAWDVLIPCGVMVLAVTVFLQQRNGGRWIIPRRFRELEVYEKVSTVDNNE